MLSSKFFSLVTAARVVTSAPFASILKAANVADTIPDYWIVVMREGLSDTAFNNHLPSRDAAVASGTKSTFNLGPFKGYHGIFSRPLIDTLATSLDVCFSLSEPRAFPLNRKSQSYAKQFAYIEPDSKLRTFALTTHF